MNIFCSLWSMLSKTGHVIARRHKVTLRNDAFRKKEFLLLILAFFLLSQSAFSAELPTGMKEALKKKFGSVVFKIDNSFTVNNKDTYLPLIPLIEKNTAKSEITNTVPDKSDKNLPKLIELSSGQLYVKLIKQKDGSQIIIDLKEIPELLKNGFLNAKFPSDLVIPKGLILKEELSTLAGNLSINIEKNPNPLAKLKLNGLLYLTSPDTGKIVYLDLSDASMIYKIQTKGAPWDITFDKTNKKFYISDFAKDLIYTLKPMESLLSTNIILPSMSSPIDIELSDDGSLLYILESLANSFVVYKTDESKLLLTTKVPSNPASFSITKDLALIAVTCPSLSSIAFLNLNDFSSLNQIMLEGNPEKIISNPANGLLYVANRDNNTVSIIDPTNKKIKNTIEVGETPTALTIDSSGKWLYIANGRSSTISIIDTENETLTETIPLPVETQFPGDIKITPDNKWLITTSETTNVISIIDLNLKQVVVKLDVSATTHAAFIYNAK